MTRLPLVSISSLLLLCLSQHHVAQSFLLQPSGQPASTTSCLFAGKNKPKSSSKTKPTSSGFGGAAIEDCPCGSTLAYAKCCGRLHTDVNAFKTATAEAVVRARYSAYAKRQVDFIMKSTHTLNENFNTDIKHWKETIRTNMYDNFELTKCVIVSEEYDVQDEIATVVFIAELVQRDSQEKTGFMETSVFERAKTNGGWLYRDGTIETPPKDNEDEEEVDAEEAETEESAKLSVEESAEVNDDKE